LQRLARSLGIAHRVEWIGYRDDVEAMYRTLAVLFLPSRSEGSPNVVLEAMAVGLPIVASAVGGVPELLRSGESGLLAASEDSAAMATQLLALLDNAHLRRKLGHAARRDVLSRFSLSARMRALRTMYTEGLK